MIEGVKVSLTNLHGLRLLMSNIGETNIKMWNHLRPDVKICKIVSKSQQPLICFKEDLKHLFYLADAMNYKNIIEIEVSSNSKQYRFFVNGFSHSIDNVENQLEGKVFVDESDDLNLLAVPLNVEIENIQIIGLNYKEIGYHHLPSDSKIGQYIVFSALNEGKQLQPRLINTESDYEFTQDEVRISEYYDQLSNSNFQSVHWQKLKIYYEICNKYRIPFSTFDQIRAISLGSEVAAKAFFFLGICQIDKNEFIQSQVISLEQDLGFCFHWIKKNDWITAQEFCIQNFGLELFNQLFELWDLYFKEISMPQLKLFLTENLKNIERINFNAFITEKRSKLGERVLKELPKITPHTTKNYSIDIDKHIIVKLLLRSPIAIAESICNKAEKSIWTNDKFTALLRRNVQYASYIAPELYKEILLQTLSIIKLN
jgi:hypothetical protein